MIYTFADDLGQKKTLKKGPYILLHLYSFWLKDQKWLAEQKRFAASAKINESECRNVAYVLQDKEWAVILETKKHPRKLGLIFTTQIILLYYSLWPASR